MIVIVDSEGDPIQEFTALYCDETVAIVHDVFHRHVRYPFVSDCDKFARSHIHGLDLNFLTEHGLCDENQLLTNFMLWLSSHPYSSIYANAPAKEIAFLSLPILDVKLKPWKERVHCTSHKKAVSKKLRREPIFNVSCEAHNYVKWKVSHKKVLSATDIAKFHFSFHCSLYDCYECMLYLLLRQH